MHVLAMGSAFALVPAAPAPAVPTHTVLHVTAHVPVFEAEPEALPELHSLPAFEVVGAEPVEPPLPEPIDPAVLPEPAPDASLAYVPRPHLRVTARMFKRPVAKPEVVAEPTPPVTLPAAVPVKAEVKPTARPAPRGSALRPREVPPLLRYYPRELRARGVEGRVMVKVTVSARGYVVDAEVLTSSGRRAFDAAALRLVRDTRFAPPGGLTQAKLPVTFRLK